jgi:hypothetical protein
MIRLIGMLLLAGCASSQPATVAALNCGYADKLLCDRQLVLFSAEPASSRVYPQVTQDVAAMLAGIQRARSHPINEHQQIAPR